MNEIDKSIDIRKLKYGTINLMKKYSHDKTYLDLHKYNLLKGNNVKLDENGILIVNIRNNYQHYPITQAIYTLECISKYYVYKDEEHKNIFLKYVEYFIKKQDTNGGWPVEFNYQYGVKETKELTSPWYSALAQGFIISSMVRAYYLTNEKRYIESALLGSKIFNIDVKDGGIRDKIFDKYVFYEEYPTTPSTHILNGYIFALIGLYDLYKATENLKVKNLLLDGLDTLKHCIGMYDIGFLSMYDLTNHTILGNPAKYNYEYHLTHCKELSALLCFDIVKESELYDVLDKVLKRWINYTDGNMAFFRLKQEECILKVSKRNYRINEVCEIFLDYDDKSKQDVQHALYISKSDINIYRYEYSSETNLHYTFKDKGEYKLTAYYKDKFSNLISKSINVSVIDEEELDVKKVNISCQQNKSNLNITVDYNGNSNNLEYAYYLIKDKEPIEKIWYKKENEHIFYVINDGTYEIKYFIRNEYGEIITDTTKKYKYEGIKRFNIHGSCISRDLFNFSSEYPISIDKYLARQSMISSVSSRIDINLNDYNLNFANNFAKKSIESDINKNIFDILKENKSDYLIIELLDERFNLVKVKNSYITNSVELQQSKLLDYINGDIIHKKDLNSDIWKECIDLYVKNIIKIYNQESIIIHKVYFLNRYLDKNNNKVEFNNETIKKNNIYNSILDDYYNYLIEKLPKAKVIDLTRDFLAYENHRWGLAPYHYEDDYYKKVLKEIYKNIKIK